MAATLLLSLTGALLFVVDAAQSDAVSTIRQRAELHKEAMSKLSANLSLRDAFESLRTLKPEAFAFLTQVLSSNNLKQRALRSRQAVVQPSSGLVKAKTMLNEMITEVMRKYEDEQDSCCHFHDEQTQAIENSRRDISSFNAEAAEAKGQILDSQAAIDMVSGQMPQVQTELERVHRECDKQISELEEEIKGVEGDIEVMNNVLAMTDCDEKNKLFLLSCRDDCTGQTYVTFDHEGWQDPTAAFRNDTTGLLLRQSLSEVYHSNQAPEQGLECGLVGNNLGPALPDMPIVANNSCECAMRCKAHPDCQGWTFSSGAFTQGSSNCWLRKEFKDMIENCNGDCRSGAKMLDSGGTEQKGARPCKAPKPKDSKEGKCSIKSNPNCLGLQDRLMAIAAGIEDNRDTMAEHLTKVRMECEGEIGNLQAQLADLGKLMKKKETDLAEAIERQNYANEQSRVQTAKFDDLNAEYRKMTKLCHGNYEKYEAEECGLRKIRAELFTMSSMPSFFQDCATSEWQENECSKTCGGGMMTKTRNIVAQPDGGTECPALTKLVKCKEFDCPVDCQMGDWSEWSSCTAKCGGGVKERQRATLARPSHGGVACSPSYDSVPCNAQACDKDCELHDWSEWSVCSKHCDGGVELRTRAIRAQQVGDGACPEEHTDKREQEKPCNTQICSSTLMCKSKLDVVLLVDGSVSLGDSGWVAIKQTAATLADHLGGHYGVANVSALLFSGPRSSGAIHKCFNINSGVDVEKDCGMTWLQHFGEGSPRDAYNKINAASYPQGSSLMSMALRQAETELSLGRSDATSIVIVLTAARPLYLPKTRKAAEDLRKKTRLMFVTVAPSANIETMFRFMSSRPIQDNFMAVSDYHQLIDPMTVDAIVADACAEVE